MKVNLPGFLFRVLPLLARPTRSPPSEAAGRTGGETPLPLQREIAWLDLDSERLIWSPNKWQAFDRIGDTLPAPKFVVLNNASPTSIVLDESICLPLLTRACSSARSTSTATLTSTSWRASARTDAPSSG